MYIKLLQSANSHKTKLEKKKEINLRCLIYFRKCTQMSVNNRKINEFSFQKCEF